MTTPLSSGATLLLRLFFPTVWLVFFGAFMVAGWLSGQDFIGPFTRSTYRAATTLFFLAGSLVFRFTVWRLYRVDISPDLLFVSSYFRTWRYTRDSVAEIAILSYGVFHLGRITLHAPGSLGRTIWFLPSRKRMEGFARQSAGWPITLT